jgi:membrane-bound ClpP family serine protease
MVVQTKKALGVMYFIAAALLMVLYITQLDGSQYFSDFSINLVAISAVLFFIMGLLVMMKMRGQTTVSRLILGVFALYYFEGAYISFQNDMYIRGMLLIAVTIFWTWYVDRGLNVLPDEEHKRKVAEKQHQRMSAAH